jgi:hypothetical protein
LPLSGSRTWQCTTAAPALAAAMALSAISRGDRGTCGERSCVAPEPVTAQVMKTSRFMAKGIATPPVFLPKGMRFAAPAQGPQTTLDLRFASCHEKGHVAVPRPLPLVL